MIQRALCVLLAILSLAYSAETPPGGYPAPQFDPQQGYTQFLIPRAAKPPVIDGQVEPGEWDQAVELNVMADQARQWKELYPRWVRWRLAWDADDLYLCSESQRLPGEDLVCRYRDQTLGGDTVLDDSIEVHFSPVGRNAVGRKLPWAAQAILNPLGVGFYSKLTWAVAAKTTAWVPEWTIGSKIHEKSWVIEMKIPRASLDAQEPNKPGDPWSLLLARNWKRTGWQQSALPAALHSFQNPREHPFAYLTDGPFARLEDLSGLVEGRIHTALRLGTCGSKPEKANVHLTVDGPRKCEKSVELDVVPGKLTEWKVAEADPLPKGTYRYELKVTSSSSKLPLLHVNFHFEPGRGAELLQETFKSTPHSFSARLAPTTSQLEVFADLLNSPDPTAAKDLLVQVRRDGEEKPVFGGASANVHHCAIEDTLGLPQLVPGAYAWTMQLRDKGGKALAEGSGKLEKKDEAKAFTWWGFQGGKTDRVLWPYEAIEVSGAGAAYWGGVFTLDGLCLPRQLQVTANQEWRPALLEGRPSVLARPIELAAAQDGKPAKIQVQGFPRTVDAKDWEAHLRGYGLIVGGVSSRRESRDGDIPPTSVEVQADATFHQDGLLWVTLTLRPSRDASSGKDVRRAEAKLDRLTLDIPLRDEVARLLVAHGTPGYGSYTIGAVPEGEGVVWDCTQAGRSALAYGDLLPIVWLGSDHRGLVFFAESNRGWVHKDTPDQQVLRQPGEVILRLNIIQAPLALRGDHAISFGLLPTPMRKMVPGWRMLNTSFSQNFADSVSTGRNTTRAEHYNASLMPASYEKSRVLMFRNTEGMITNLGGFEFAPHTERGGYETLSADAPARDYFGPEWSQNTWTPSFQNHLFWAMQKWMDEGGLTGLYHDQFCPHPVTNRITGAAWALPDGRTNRGYNMLLDRAYNVREHALFLEDNITPRVFCHTTNGGQVIAYPWVSAILDGEDNNIIANADYDFADIYSPARMQAYGNPWPWGNTFFWMRLIAKGNDDWQNKQDNAYLGWTVLHDVMYANGVEQALRPTLFEWGMNDRRVKFWPYWRNRQVVSCSNPDVLVSLWTLPDRALLCAFNTSKAKTATGTIIRVPLEDLGLLPKVRSEYIRGTGAPFDAWSGKFAVDIPPHGFRMLDIRKYVD